ncbi:MAG: hypothetical protein IPQ08_06475 [Chitinophagaceae bacterium]|nr:hypothetical protein [Chitinophagaceae bacterium]
MRKLWEKIGTAEIRNILAVISVLGFFIIIVLLIMKPIPDGNKDVVNIIVGFLGAGLVGGVAGYYFGASKAEKIEKV